MPPTEDARPDRNKIAARSAARARRARQRLISRRDRLASAAAAHTSHDLPGGDLLWQAVHEVEEEIRDRFPGLWRHVNGVWVASDARRLHAPDELRPGLCELCSAAVAASIEDEPAPPRAS